MVLRFLVKFIGLVDWDIVDAECYGLKHWSLRSLLLSALTQEDTYQQDENNSRNRRH